MDLRTPGAAHPSRRQRGQRTHSARLSLYSACSDGHGDGRVVVLHDVLEVLEQRLPY